MKIFGPLVVGAALCAIAVSPATAGPLATLHAGSAGLEWRPLVADAGLTFTVSGPEGFYLRQELTPGQSPSFSVFDEAGNLRPAGAYVWELRAVFQLDEGTRQELEGVRSSGDRGALQKAGKLPSGPTYESGSFSILDGAIVAGELEEPGRPGAGSGNVLAPKVVLTNANGVIRNALCVGFDCPDAPAFGDSSILMMENNNRIKFGDTSAAPFPNNDWEIEANSATSGGLSYLGFNDCGTADNDGGCATDLVFAVEAGARSSALYVESDGDVGLGTSNPVLDLHIVTGNTPSLRLDQDGSSGFTPQAWDVAGNETNFFVRDVTGGSQLPFRILGGANGNSIVIDADGEVGLGTASPSNTLHVTRSNGTAKLLIAETNGTASAREIAEFQNNGNAVIILEDTSVAERWTYTGGTNYLVNNQANAGVEYTFGPTGNLTIAGSLTVGPGGCTGCDLVFSPHYELESIEEHAAYMWRNSHLPGVGPTPEDAPMNLSQKTGGILNELEKAHIFIEQLHGTIEALQVDNVEKSRALLSLEERLARLEASVSPKPE